MPDYYQILGVEPESTSVDIKKIYRKLVLKYHPDICTEENAEDKFKEIVEAFNVLSDPHKKAEYDKKYSVVSPFPDIKKNRLAKVNIAKKLISDIPELISKLVLKIRTIVTPHGSRTDGDEEYFCDADGHSENVETGELVDKFYNSDNKYVRMHALKCLVARRGKRAFKEIQKAFTDISKEVRFVAIKATGYLNIRQFLSELAELYKKSGREIRKEIVTAYGKMDSKKVSDLIIKACFDADDNVKIEALNLVKKIKVVPHKDRFNNLAYEKNEEVKKLAKEIMENG